MWIKSLESNETNKTKQTPAECLLNHLSMRICTVGVLVDLLEDCNLLRALTIIHLPKSLTIIEHPNYDKNDISIAMGNNLKLKCQAIGLPPPSYNWYHENLSLNNQNKAVLNLIINSIDQEGEYKCLISQIDLQGLIIEQKFTESVYLSIKSMPVIIKIQPTPFIEIKENEILQLNCIAESHPSPQYQWFRDNTKLDEQTLNVLKIERFRAKDEGKYYCQITNDISQIYTKKSNVVVSKNKLILLN